MFYKFVLLRRLNYHFSEVHLLRKKTAFSIDNEAFRYLIAHSETKHYSWKKYYSCFEDSWDISRDEIISMLKVIESNMKNKSTVEIAELKKAFEYVQLFCQVNALLSFK